MAEMFCNAALFSCEQWNPEQEIYLFWNFPFHIHMIKEWEFQKKILLSTWLFLYITWFAPLWKISRGHIIMVPDKTPQIFKKYILEKNSATKVLAIYFNNHLIWCIILLLDMYHICDPEFSLPILLKQL